VAKQRMINTEFWKDEYIQDLSPSNKLLFLYLLTNESNNIAGVYKISLRTISFETGLKLDAISRGMDTLSIGHKVVYKNGWVWIVNFIKNQNNGEKIKRGIEIALSKVPSEIVNDFGGFRYPIDTLCIPLDDINSNSNSNPNSNLKSSTMSIWNSFAKENNLSELLKIDGKRMDHLLARTKEDLFHLNSICLKINQSDFLLGKEKSWKVDFDFIVKNKENYVKILEGKYDNKQKKTSNSFKGLKFAN